jgi:hypothetical protein
MGATRLVPEYESLDVALALDGEQKSLLVTSLSSHARLCPHARK